MIDDYDELPAKRQNSQLVDWLMNASPIDLKQIDADISEQQAYLDRLKKARRLIAGVVGETFEPVSKLAGKKRGETAALWQKKFAAVLAQESPLKMSQIMKRTGASSDTFYRNIATEWFEKTPAGYVLTEIGAMAVQTKE